MNPKVRIRLFGKLAVQCGDNLLVNLNSRKAQELLCYLLLHRTRAHHREELADLLWGEQSSVQARKYLRHSLWQLQNAFGEQNKASAQFILLVELEWLHVNVDSGFWLDVAEFEEAFLALQINPGKGLDEQLAYRLQQAVLLYQGDLLEGWYADWCIFERERLQSMYLTMLDKLLDHCTERHDYEQAISYGLQILRYDRARERTHQALMQLHALAGDRTAALRQYEACTDALAEELDVAPSERTVALWDAIRTEQFNSPIVAMLSANSFVQPLTGSQPHPLQFLHELQRSLIKMAAQLDEYLSHYEQSIDGHR